MVVGGDRGWLVGCFKRVNEGVGVQVRTRPVQSRKKKEAS